MSVQFLLDKRSEKTPVQKASTFPSWWIVDCGRNFVSVSDWKRQVLLSSIHDISCVFHAKLYSWHADASLGQNGPATRLPMAVGSSTQPRSQLFGDGKRKIERWHTDAPSRDRGILWASLVNNCAQQIRVFKLPAIQVRQKQPLIVTLGPPHVFPLLLIV